MHFTWIVSFRPHGTPPGEEPYHHVKEEMSLSGLNHMPSIAQLGRDRQSPSGQCVSRLLVLLSVRHWADALAVTLGT